jgi:hypothetical protein
MKFLLFKLLLQRRARDEGFTLPMVMALGLIMILLSAVHVVQSGDENLVSLASNNSSEALAMAEVGIAEYRELLNRNRVLAVHNQSNWSTVDNTATQPQVCDSNVSTFGDTTQWHPINDGSVNIGSYQLVSYVYDNDGDIATNNNGQLDLTSDAANNARGILTVAGKTSDSAAIDEDSVAQIQVEIPIGINANDSAAGVIGDLDSLVPALWLQQGDITASEIGTLTINDGNLVLYRPAGAGGCDDPADLSGNNTISDPRTLPPITTITTQKTAAVTANRHNTLPATISTDTRLADGAALFFPNPPSLSCDTEDTDCRYYYVRNGDLTIDNADILIDGKAKVIIYVDGDLTINNSVNLVNSSDFTISAFDSNSPPSFLGSLKTGWTTTSASSRFLEIHVTGDVNITGAGNVNIKGLINAPTGKVTINSGSTVNLVGSLWANEWDNFGTVTITPDDYKFYNLTTLRTPKPIMYPPRKWEKQEAQ